LSVVDIAFETFELLHLIFRGYKLIPAASYPNILAMHLFCKEDHSSDWTVLIPPNIFLDSTLEIRSLDNKSTLSTKTLGTSSETHLPWIHVDEVYILVAKSFSQTSFSQKW